MSRDRQFICFALLLTFSAWLGSSCTSEEFLQKCSHDDECEAGSYCAEAGYCVVPVSQPDQSDGESEGLNPDTEEVVESCEACGVGQECCESEEGLVCVDTQASVENCGACGRSCHWTESCFNGECGCSLGLGDCNGDPSDGCEQDIFYDITTCGSCDNSCFIGGECVAGECLCPSGFLSCNGDFADGCEISYRDNDDHCGQCDNACLDDMACELGECICVLGYAECDDEPGCEDLQNDNQHCGQCGRACVPPENCSAGACSCNGSVCAEGICCPPQGAGEDPYCTNLQSSNNNCGACGVTCIDDAQCVEGSCLCGGVACGEGTHCCDGACVPVEQNCFCGENPGCVDGELCCPGDPGGELICQSIESMGYCGSCDLRCDLSTQHCELGIEACRCNDESQLLCDGVCVDNNTLNCGSCGTTCAANEVCCGGGCAVLGSVETCPASSCDAIYQSGIREDGVYWLQVGNSVFQAYCNMVEDEGELQGGWTLLMRLTGDGTFQYDSDYWKTPALLNENDLSPDVTSPAKFAAFNHLPLDWVWAHFPDLPHNMVDEVPNDRTALQNFDTYHELDVDEDWYSSWPKQDSYEEKAFKLYGCKMEVRWGWVWNEYNFWDNWGGSCSSADVVDGIGMSSDRDNPYDSGAFAHCCTEYDNYQDGGSPALLWGK